MNSKKIGMGTLIMLIFAPTFEFYNITNNAVTLGPASIPSWLVVSVLFFLPLSGIIAELASANSEKEGGIYAWIESGLGSKWSYIGTWSYFIANLFYLQLLFSRIPVLASWAVFGANIFNDSTTYLISYFSIALVVLLTFISTKGVQKFSKLCEFGGKFTIVATVLFIAFAIIGYFKGTPSASHFNVVTVIPQINSSYLSTFSWLLFAVTGAEAAGTYIDKVDNPNKVFPRSVIIATALIAFSYIVGSIAVCLVSSQGVLAKAGIKDANYVVYKILAEDWGLNGKIVVQIYAAIVTITTIAATVVWVESPVRAMFSDVPKGTFPDFLVKKDRKGNLANALWVQCLIVCVLIAVPALGLNSLNSFFELVTNMSSLSLMIPYIFLAASFLIFRLKGEDAPFKMFKSKALAVCIALLVLILCIAGFFGAGLDSIVSAKTVHEAIKSVIMNYGGPIILVLAGYIISLIPKTKIQLDIKKEID